MNLIEVCTVSVFIIIILLCIVKSYDSHGLGMKVENSSCGCNGDTLTYTCTVSGGVSTVWQGSAFRSCRVSLLHAHFASGSGVGGTCNHGNIVGQSQRYSMDYSTNTRYYTSYLRVTVSPDLNNMDIQCLHQINTQLILIGSYNISIISGTRTYNINCVNSLILYVYHFRVCTFTSNRYLLVPCKLQSHFFCMGSTSLQLSTLHFCRQCIKLW